MLKEEYIKVSLLDVIRACGLAKNNNENPEVIQKLVNIFTSSENSEMIELSINSPEAKCILKYNNNVVFKNYITLESLGLALNKLVIGKNNKELQKRIEKYYRIFLENITHNEDNTELKQEIIADGEAFQLIKQHSTYASYEREIVGKKSKRKVLVNNQQEQVPAIRGKAIVE